MKTMWTWFEKTLNVIGSWKLPSAFLAKLSLTSWDVSSGFPVTGSDISSFLPLSERRRTGLELAHVGDDVEEVEHVRGLLLAWCSVPEHSDGVLERLQRERAAVAFVSWWRGGW